MDFNNFQSENKLNPKKLILVSLFLLSCTLYFMEEHYLIRLTIYYFYYHYCLIVSL